MKNFNKNQNELELNQKNENLNSNEKFEELVKNMEELQEDEQGNLKGGFMSLSSDKENDTNSQTNVECNNCGLFCFG